MEFEVKKIYTLLVVLLTFLVGLTGCDDSTNSAIDEDDAFDQDAIPDNDSDYEPQPDNLYGCPYASFYFNISGNVTDKDGNPVKGIKLTYNYYADGSSQDIEATSDEKGDFELMASGDVSCTVDEGYKIAVEDVDGAANGAFENKEITNFGLNCKDSGGESGWSEERHCIADNVNITLKNIETPDAEVDEDLIPDEETEDADIYEEDDVFTDIEYPDDEII